ncbi:MAG: exopolysaccharide biosynthesis polyprenyl glycosylphosphotransferase [Bacteroidia bacterium]|nr:exopolysaccharide biosynthesis polyprenyl glycosylphosphotransferase [Bacteroidia bacterium]
MKVKKQRIIFGYIFLELLLLCISNLLVLYWSLKHHVYYDLDPVVFTRTTLLLNLVYLSSWILTVFINNAQDVYFKTRIGHRAQVLGVSGFILLGLSVSAIFFAGINLAFIEMALKTVGLFFVLNLITLEIVQKSFSRFKKYRSFGAKMLVLGAGEKGKEVLDFVSQNKHLGYDVVGFLDDDYPGSNGINLLGRMKDLSRVLDTKPVDEIVIALPFERKMEIQTAIHIADNRGIRVNLVPEFPPEFEHNYKSYSIGGMPVYQLKQIPLDQFHNFILKKGFDILFALSVLVFLFPVFLIIGILIKIGSKGPVFYKPLRKGQAGGTFVCYKFRTMSDSDDAVSGTRSTVVNDPRITRIGKYLRKLDLDELPQFINVLKGDMSVVGPRPHRLNLNDDFREVVNEYMVRHYVKPGLTGWAQVNGWRGPTETEEQKRQRVAHDLWYINHWSIWLDIKIIFLTVFSKKTRQNAF